MYELFWGFVTAFENCQNHSIDKFENIEQFCFHLSLFANNKVGKDFNVIFNVVSKSYWLNKKCCLFTENAFLLKLRLGNYALLRQNALMQCNT